MRYFSITEVVRAIIGSSFLGFLMGGLYNSLSTLISCTCRLLGVWITVLRSHSISNCKECTIQKKEAASVARKSVYDLMFFVVFGVLYVFLCYLTLDGAHRFYVLIPLIIVFFLSKQTLGVVFEKIILIIYNVVYRAVFFVLYVLTFPLRIVYRLTYKLLERPFKCAFKFLEHVVSAIHIRKKQKQIYKYFKSSPTIFS